MWNSLPKKWMNRVRDDMSWGAEALVSIFVTSLLTSRHTMSRRPRLIERCLQDLFILSEEIAYEIIVFQSELGRLNLSVLVAERGRLNRSQTRRTLLLRRKNKELRTRESHI
jgi:hypothetical protein